MKILDSKELIQVAGGANLYITQQIPTNGISDACINDLMQLNDLLASNAAFDEQTCFLCACSENDLEIFIDRIHNTLPTQISYQ